MFAKTYKTCQQFKNRKTLYRHLLPKNIKELKPLDLVHVDLIGPYSKSIRPHYLGGAIMQKDDSLTCMTMIDPATGWFEVVEIMTFDLDELTAGNDEYIDKSSARVSQLFNNTWLCRYLRPRKVVFDNGSEFKQDFTPLLKDSDIEPVLTSVTNPQANAPVERLHQVMLNMIVTNDLYNKVFNYIYPWGENLAYIAWEIRASYHRTIMDTSGQSVFGRDMLFNLTSVFDWQVATAAKQHQVDIDNVRENAKRVTHE